MQKEEYNKMLNEMKPFMEKGKITALTENKWLESKGIISIIKGEVCIKMKPNSYETEYQAYRKKLTDFWKFIKYLKLAKSKKKVEKRDDLITDALSKF